MQSKLDQRCFHPHITGEEAERQLKASGNHGSFLCRRSGGDPNTYTLSVLNFGEIIHLRMKYTAPYFSLCDADQFDSPFDVIQHYLNSDGIPKKNGGGVIRLITPLINENTIKSRWYHGDIHPEVVETLLNDKGQDGSFLVRASYKSPGDYSLCVRVKDEIVHVKIHGKGKKFDLGVGNQFDSVEDLIDHYRKYPFGVGGGALVRLHEEIEHDLSFDPSGGACRSRSKSLQRYLTPILSEGNVWRKDMRCVLTIDGVTVPLNPALGPQVPIQGGMMKANPDGTIGISGKIASDRLCQFQFWSLINHPSKIYCIESCAYQNYYLHWDKVGEKIKLLKITDDHERDKALRIRWILFQDPDYPSKKYLLQAWDEVDPHASRKYLVFNSIVNKKVKLQNDREKATFSYTIEALLYASQTYAKQNAAVTLIPLSND